MASILGNLIVKLTTDDSGMVKGMERGRKHVGRLKREVRGLSGGINALVASYVGFRAATKAVELIQQGAVMEREKTRFEKFAGGVDKARQMLVAFNIGAGHTVDNLTALQQAGRFVNLEIAKTPQQMKKIAEVAIRMGDQTMTTKQRLDQFGSLMANQSYLRLDTFGISSARVHARMAVLKKEFPEMNKEARFLKATFEEIDKKLAVLGPRMDSVADKLERLKAAGENFKMDLGSQLGTMLADNASVGVLSGTSGGGMGEMASIKISRWIDWAVTNLRTGVQQMIGMQLQGWGNVFKFIMEGLQSGAKLFGSLFGSIADKLSKIGFDGLSNASEKFSAWLKNDAARYLAPHIPNAMIDQGDELLLNAGKLLLLYDEREAARKRREVEITNQGIEKLADGGQSFFQRWRDVAKAQEEIELEGRKRTLHLEQTLARETFMSWLKDDMAALEKKLGLARMTPMTTGPVRAVEAGTAEAANFIASSIRAEREAQIQRQQAENVKAIRDEMEQLRIAIEQFTRGEVMVDFGMFGAAR